MIKFQSVMRFISTFANIITIMLVYSNIICRLVRSLPC